MMQLSDMLYNILQNNQLLNKLIHFLNKSVNPSFSSLFSITILPRVSPKPQVKTVKLRARASLLNNSEQDSSRERWVKAARRVKKYPLLQNFDTKEEIELQGFNKYTRRHQFQERQQSSFQDYENSREHNQTYQINTSQDEASCIDQTSYLDASLANLSTSQIQRDESLPQSQAQPVRNIQAVIQALSQQQSNIQQLHQQQLEELFQQNSQTLLASQIDSFFKSFPLSPPPDSFFKKGKDHQLNHAALKDQQHYASLMQKLKNPRKAKQFLNRGFAMKKLYQLSCTRGFTSRWQSLNVDEIMFCYGGWSLNNKFFSNAKDREEMFFIDLVYQLKWKGQFKNFKDLMNRAYSLQYDQ